ncbi:MAG TPA: DUF4383 domain-containing protein [Magnetospirillum sp.]|jgi:hypothetical protein|nr:DUF4383 domain-containing protein [Magnetospirillum sp.]
MRTRVFALLLGIGFLIGGILGFVPRLVIIPPDQPPMIVGASHGLLLGLFPVNAVHNAVHLLFGVWGVVVWRSFAASRTYCRSVAIIYAVATVLGLIPDANTLFGVMPLQGLDVPLHAVIAIVAAYFGYAAIPAVESGPAIRRP